MQLKILPYIFLNFVDNKAIIITNMENNRKIKTKSLVKHMDNKWLDYVRKGIKTFEGRINTGDWVNVRSGDHIKFYDQYGIQSVKILSIKHYIYFSNMWDDLGDRLLPGVKNRQHALNIYKNIYLHGVGYTEEEMIEKGVVAFEIVCVD